MTLFKEELRLFFTALQFFTRVPVPAWVGWSPAQLNASARWFPLVGVVVGAVAGGVYEAALWLWPTSVAVLLSMAASVLLTGAFHEDGWADSCDGFGGGGSDRPRVLAIMKDSRVGSYAVVGLVLMLGVKYQALLAVQNLSGGQFVAVSVASHALSRAAVLWVMARLVYVREDALAKSKPIAQGIGAGALMVGVLTAALPAATLGGAGLAAGLACAGVAAVAVPWLRARLGGYVGDALGATQQMAEVACLLALLACWRGE